MTRPSRTSAKQTSILFGALVLAGVSLAPPMVRSQSSYSLVTLTSSHPGGSHALGLNNHGAIVGTWLGDSAGTRGYVWTQSTGALPVPDLAVATRFPMPTAYNDPGSRGTSINSAGAIAGWACVTTCSQPERGAAVWTPTGGLTFLGSFTGDPAGSQAAAINDAGTIVGTAPGGGYNSYGPFIWTAATGLQRLTGFVGLNGFARDINNSGLVVGTRGVATTGRQMAFVWSTAGGQVDIPDFPGATQSYGLAVNDAGVVVGHATLSNGSDMAFRWSAASGLQALNAPGTVELMDINSAGDIVAAVFPPGGGRASYLYRSGTWTNILSLIPAGANFAVNSVRRINDRGWIIGIGGVNAAQGFVLIPQNLPPTATASTLSATEDVAAAGLLTATDPEGAPLTYRIVGIATKGVATIANVSTGAFTYVPFPNATGLDAFSFVASDGSLDSSPASVSVSIASVNDAPVAMDAATTVIAGSTVSGALTATDVDGPSLTYSIVANGSQGQALITNPGTGAFTYSTPATASGADSFTFRANDGLADSNVATVSVSIAPAPTTVQPPGGFRVDNVAGNQVRLRWNPPPTGPRPTGYVVDGGLRPGETFGSIATGPVPVLTFTAPTGSFFVRVRSVSATDTSVASNEVPLHVNVPVVPSSPSGLTGLNDRGFLHLRWRNTFGGAPPSDIILNVTGPLTGAVSLGAIESFNHLGVPSGTYSFSVTARNAAGSSAPSNTVTITFPSPCAGAPNPPENFTFYEVGGTVWLLWDPPSTGAAPTGYAINVSGAVNTLVPISTRTLTAPVPPGTYSASVLARNACGSSTPTAVQTVTVP